jgi:hypothetical protein
MLQEIVAKLWHLKDGVKIISILSQLRELTSLYRLKEFLDRKRKKILFIKVSRSKNWKDTIQTHL